MYVIIVGCGRVGAELAQILQGEGHNVVIIDRDPGAFRRLGANFNGITLAGNGFDLDVLVEAGIEKADAFCAVTNGDNTNIMASQIARTIYRVPTVLARVYDPPRAAIYRDLGLHIISGTVLFAAMLRDKIVDPRFTGFLIETGELGVLEIPPSAARTGKKVGELTVPGEFLVATVLRRGEAILPGPETVLEEGDKLMAVVKTKALGAIKKRFGL
ncbi:MAG: TrkA family potassium uptake protein [Candidatus Aureabacteria bacterium]|nr:TrkA family potassium uptake protein [Candidatus Auribacterota bacterium]